MRWHRSVYVYQAHTYMSVETKYFMETVLFDLYD